MPEAIKPSWPNRNRLHHHQPEVPYLISYSRRHRPLDTNAVADEMYHTVRRPAFRRNEQKDTQELCEESLVWGPKVPVCPECNV
jgi:hypothetical protein